MSSLYLSHTLPCGLRIVHMPSTSPVAYCGLAVNAGSRDEKPEHYGIAHFVEHTIFKGTTHRKSFHIVNRMERIGGELNAYTSKEETFLYSIFPAEHYPRALELMADLVQNSIFPSAELEKEREVVLDELDSYRDMPSEAIYDDFEDIMFKGSGLGHNILGFENTLNNLVSADCMNFLKQLYVPKNMVLFSYGNINFDRLCKMAEKWFGMMNHSLNRIERVAPPMPEKSVQHIAVDAHQSHVIYGVRTFGMYDKRKYPLALLNNMLGGPGMNSILNIDLREKHGYVYTVESNTSLFTDSGLFTIYFGCDDNHVKPCLRLISKNIQALAEKPLNQNKLDLAKKQYLGQMLVSNDNREAVALALGKSYLYFNEFSSNEEITERINAISVQDIQDIATLLCEDNASILTMD